jgi:hypothetical protein
MQTIFEKCPLKKMASSQNFFVWFRRVLICQRGLIPCRIKSYGVSDPTELSIAGYQTPQNNGRFVYIFTADTCSARSDNPQNNILRGIKPRRTTLKYEYFCKFETEFKIIPVCVFGAYMGSIRGKNRR